LKNNSNFTQALWVGLGSLSSFLMTIVSSIILARLLSKSDYGTYRQVLYVYNTLLIIFTAGIPKAYTYFMPRFDIEQQKDVVNKITKILMLLGLCLSIILFFSSEIIADLLKNSKLEYSLKIFSPIPLLLFPTLGIEGIFATLKKTKYIALYQIISRMIQVISIVIPVIYFGGSYIEAIYGWLISSTFLFFIALYLKNFPFKKYLTKASGITFNTIFKYSFPIMIAGLYGIGTRSADQFFISRYYGTEIFAVYANGKLQLPFVTMVVTAVSTVLAPQFSKLYYEGGEKAIQSIKNLWNSSLEKSITIIYPLLLFFMFFSNEVFDALYGYQYIDSSNYFVILSFISFFQIIIFAPLVLAIGMTKFYVRIHMIEFVLMWSLGYFCIYFFNTPYSIPILVAILSILKIIISFKYVAKKLNISFFDMIPIKIQCIHIIHSGLILILLRFFFNYLNINSSFLVCFIAFILYSITLLATSKWVKIDYLYSVRHLLKKVPILKNF
jgi:O-antigen/teichoic acid export membrane protein